MSESNSKIFERKRMAQIGLTVFSTCLTVFILAGKTPFFTLTFDATKPLPTGAIKGMLARKFQLEERLENWFIINEQMHPVDPK